MKCPHCAINFHDNWFTTRVARHGQATNWAVRTAECPGCEAYSVDLTNECRSEEPGWFRVYPIGANRGPVPTEVPITIAIDYIEADQVLPISPKASAALSRRCLQSILWAHGYKAKDLAKEIDLLLNEQDPIKAIPGSLRDVIDAVRNFGNFSAHPINDVTQLQIIDVEPEEAEWCLEILEEMFQHFYVRPGKAAARKVALNAKLAAAGKPPAK